MAAKYLVTCVRCGDQVAASVHQAGSTVQCQCGEQVVVPPLRKLKLLPPAETPTNSRSTQWSSRQSIAVCGSSLTLGLLLWAAYLWTTEPEPLQFPEQNYAKSVENLVVNGTPLDFWQSWVANRDALMEDGFQEIALPQAVAVDAYISQRQFQRNVLLAIAGGFAVLTGITWAVWPTRKMV